jgi:hypothetical protein
LGLQQSRVQTSKYVLEAFQESPVAGLSEQSNDTT